jgi:hypothetical protein
VRMSPAAVPAVACCAVVFVPWATTGIATRSGFAFLRAASEAGLLGALGAHLLEVFVFALPTLAALSCTAAVLGAPFFSAVSSCFAGVVVGAFSLEMFIFFGARAAVGPWLGLVSATAAIAISARCLVKMWPGGARLAVKRGKVQSV